MIDDIEQDEDSYIISQLIEKTQLTQDDHANQITQLLLNVINEHNNSN